MSVEAVLPAVVLGVLIGFAVGYHAGRRARAEEEGLAMADERNAEGLTRGEANLREEVKGAVEVRLAQLRAGGAGGGLDLSPGVITEAADAAADAALDSIKGGKTP